MGEAVGRYVVGGAIIRVRMVRHERQMRTPGSIGDMDIVRCPSKSAISLNVGDLQQADAYVFAPKYVKDLLVITLWVVLASGP